ncbi:MAG TPA: alkaline phosphatase D family protein [Gemmatimonadaceae bacterium]|nr:alkaline phosphatase D family protein [Gemmatimonadaceae bacterium]
MQRRDFLADLAMYSALCSSVPNIWRVTSRPVLADNPFTLGVASGDPTPTGAVLWTRLAPKPYEPDAGTMGQRITVNWEVAEDEQFGKVVKRGRATAAPELGNSIHVDVDGLEPDHWYFYRFTLQNGSSPVGRLRTTPALTAERPLRFAFVSCQHFEQGYYTAYEHLAREPQLDLVAHLGDYIYEYGPTEGRPRIFSTTEAITLEQYRWRYSQTKMDANLQAAHLVAPWLVTWDDHEVDNNYAGLVGQDVMESEEQMHARRAAAYQAWWEHQPVRVPRAKSWGDLNIIRTMDWGTLAKFHVVDTRQYRSDQACDDGDKDTPCGAWADPARTMMGPAQEQWLDAGLGASRARWQVLANQVQVAPFDHKNGAGENYSMDQWGGYPAALKRLMTTIANRAPNRTVIVTGDIHSNWVNELRTDYKRGDAKTIGAEFVGTSISSGGDGFDEFRTWNDASRAENPHVKWHNARRGYVMNDVGPDAWKASYRVVPFVSKPGAPVQTPAEFVTHHGRPGIERA